MDTGGIYTTLNVPGAILTDAYGINDAGQVVGLYIDNAGIAHGFVDTGGIYTTLDVPGASLTEAYGINDAGQVVGLYQDASGPHGFLATSVPEPSTLALCASWRLDRRRR